MSRKVIITVGGTGGHVFPAMSFAKQLIQEDPSIQLLFVGGGLKKNLYFDHKTFPHQEILCGNFVKRDPLSLLINAGKITKGIWDSYRLLQAFKPDLVVGFGSYHTVPVLSAAKLSGIPYILHEANSVPGKVNRFFSKYAVTTGIYFPESANQLRGNTEEVGMPLRAGYSRDHLSKEAALRNYGFSADKTTLLVFGGSQGAQAINTLFSEAIQLMPEDILKSLQLLHFTGASSQKETVQQIYADKGITAVVKNYETQMDLAWKCADLMVSRSGAGTIAEAVVFDVPGVLIPYPQAMDNHQEKNADFMVDHVKGAIKLNEKQLTSAQLAQSLEELLVNECAQLNQLRESMSQYKKIAPKRDLCALIREFLRKCYTQLV